MVSLFDLIEFFYGDFIRKCSNSIDGISWEYHNSSVFQKINRHCYLFSFDILHKVCNSKKIKSDFLFFFLKRQTNYCDYNYIEHWKSNNKPNWGVGFCEMWNYNCEEDSEYAIDYWARHYFFCKFSFLFLGECFFNHFKLNKE